MAAVKDADTYDASELRSFRFSVPAALRIMLMAHSYGTRSRLVHQETEMNHLNRDSAYT